MRRVVAAAHGDLAEAKARIELLRRAVARAHFQENVLRAEPAREPRRFAKQRRAVAAPLVRHGDRQVEEMRLARRHHQDEVADQLAIDAPGAAFVPGAQRIGEVGMRPGVRVDGLLDRHHLGQVFLPHALELRNVLEDRAHRLASSAFVKATLSRT